jgi:hypothetical protein
MTQLEYIDASDGGRPLDLMLFYPAAPAATELPFKIFMASNLRLRSALPLP